MEDVVEACKMDFIIDTLYAHFLGLCYAAFLCKICPFVQYVLHFFWMVENNFPFFLFLSVFKCRLA